MRVFIQFVASLFLLSFFISCDPAPSKLKALSDFIPKNPSVVFSINDFEALKSDLRNNSFLSNLKNAQAYSYLKNKEIFKHLHPNSKSILCISEGNDEPAFTFMTKLNKDLFNTDSIAGHTIENSSFNSFTFQKVIINKQAVFTAVEDSIFFASNSKKTLANILSGKNENNAIFKKITALSNRKDLTAFIPANEILANQILFNFGSWAALNIEVLPDALTASGVVLTNDSVPQLISIFKGLNPQQNQIAKVTPTNAHTIVSLTFDDFALFQNNLQNFRGIKSIKDEETILFEAVNEVSKISFSKGNAIVLKSIDPQLTNEALQNFSSPKAPFKGIMIHRFNEPNLFVNHFLTFTNRTAPKEVFILDNFFVFSENEEVTQNIINSYLQNNCLSSTSYYKEALSQLSDESSLLVMKLNGDYSEAISTLLKTEIAPISFKKYPIAILQFNYDRDFAHVNFVCKEASTSNSKKIAGKVTQINSIQLENELLNNPTFFSNHRTGGKDIVVQDVTNKMYFISSGGKILWTKKLKNPILGKIEEVDLLRNGKKQLAFTTKNNFYILDRTGRAVAPFPIKFRDEITQGISVFDYDNNRKYRFVITQGKEPLMLDSKGKKVKGFRFKKTKSNIVFPPQHFRIKSKDYIIIAEENGKLNILSRIGKPRVTVSKTFDFSNTPITLEKSKLVVINKDNSKNSVGLDGKTITNKLKVTSYHFTVKGKTKVTLDDNLMRINGVLIELPFGIYTAPTISIVNRKTYISITETQENKVYVYNKSGNLLSGFPVYGTSIIDLGDLTKNGKTNFLVKGAAKNIIVYEIH
ncbi:DUF3352 domain-containing protein [Flavobacteriaceae bacterium]|nr:DUF3352 domain-containing protein [Flavobacteriaceae bacterium]